MRRKKSEGSRAIDPKTRLWLCLQWRSRRTYFDYVRWWMGRSWMSNSSTSSSTGMEYETLWIVKEWTEFTFNNYLLVGVLDKSWFALNFTCQITNFWAVQHDEFYWQEKKEAKNFRLSSTGTQCCSDLNMLVSSLICIDLEFNRELIMSIS